jgi:hypothetical protein
MVRPSFRWDILANYASFVEKFSEINDPSGSIIRNGGVFKVGDRVDKLFTRAYLRTPDGQVIHGSNGLPLNGPSGVQGNQFIGYGNNNFSWAINNKFTYKSIFMSFQFVVLFTMTSGLMVRGVVQIFLLLVIQNTALPGLLSGKVSRKMVL